jgi:Bacterial conjugation TrbI-like protein
MEQQENRLAHDTGGETPGIPDEDLRTELSEEGERGEPRWREIFRQAFEKARKAQAPVSSRRELGKDKRKSLLMLAGAVIAVVLVFLGVFSSSNKAKRPQDRRAAPDLGRRVTPGQESAEAGKSPTPLLDADVRANQTANNGMVTAEDIDRTARLHGPASAPPAQKKDQYALNRVDFSDPALRRQPGYGVGPAYQQPPAVPQPPGASEAEELRKPSLVFVRSVNESTGSAAVSPQPVALEQRVPGPDLPPGTRLVARLEAPASSAMKQPVIAVVEYNYERDGETIVPAGAKAVGQLRQADRNGFVDIKFESLEMPDGSAEKLDGVAMGLDFKPLKGAVAGKKTGTKFLVRTLTGVGSAAAFLVGGTSSSAFSGLSEDALLRERIASNIGVAGDQQLNELAFNQNIVVTIPGNTRFYIVLENTSSANNATLGGPASVAVATPRNRMPTLDELRQLMELKQELSAMYQQASAPGASAQPQQQ